LRRDRDAAYKLALKGCRARLHSAFVHDVCDVCGENPGATNLFASGAYKIVKSHLGVSFGLNFFNQPNPLQDRLNV
jgi:hypothetical protein